MSYAFNSQAQDFNIINSTLAKKLMSEKKPTFIKKIEKNDCSVFKLKGDKYVVYSSVSRYSILFKKFEDLKKIEKMKSYPTGLETNDIRETEQIGILNISSNVDSYIKELSEKFNIQLNLTDIKVLDSLDTKIQNFGIEKLTERDIFLISLYLDEFFRNNTDTYWVIEKVFTLNTFWIPFLKRKDSKKEYSLYRSISKSYNENESGSLNLKLNYLLELADYKGLSPFSKEHIDFINSY